MNKNNLDKFIQFTRKFGINIKKIEHYEIAFTHPSYSKFGKNSKAPNYEKLEFLGDSLLQFLSSLYLMSKYKNKNEGQLTLMRVQLVSTKNLNRISNDLGLKQFLLTGPGLIQKDVLTSAKVGADVFESFIGALYIDQGLQKVNSFLNQTLFQTQIDTTTLKDSKTRFQEYVQSFSRIAAIYNTIQESEKRFFAELNHDGQIYGIGYGASKLEAEENAAKDALDKMAIKQN